jgi:hypothetical protein
MANTLLDALSAALEGKKVSMDADGPQSAPAPDAVNKPEHDGEKPGVPVKPDKKDGANAGDPKGPDNTKKIRTGDNQAMGNDNAMAKEAEAFITKAVETGVTKVAAVLEQHKVAKEEASRLNEQLTKIASLTPEELQKDWGDYVAAGQQFGIGIWAGQAKLAMEMDEAGGEDAEIEAVIEQVAQGVAEQIANELPPEQLQDPAVQQEIEEVAMQVAEEEVADAMGQASEEAANIGGGGDMGGGEGGPPPEMKE